MISNSWQLLTKAEQRTNYYFIILVSFANILETVSLIGVMPLVAITIEPETVSKSVMMQKLINYIGNPSFNNFVLFLAISSLSLILIGNITKLFIHYKMRMFNIKCQNRLSSQLSEMLLNAPYAWYFNKNSSALATIMSYFPLNSFCSTKLDKTLFISRILSLGYFLSGKILLAFSKDAPAMIGNWVGWQILRSYMNNNSDVSLQDLLAEMDAKKILKFSGYKPKQK